MIIMDNNSYPITWYMSWEPRWKRNAFPLDFDYEIWNNHLSFLSLRERESKSDFSGFRFLTNMLHVWRVFHPINFCFTFYFWFTILVFEFHPLFHSFLDFSCHFALALSNLFALEKLINWIFALENLFVLIMLFS